MFETRGTTFVWYRHLLRVHWYHYIVYTHFYAMQQPKEVSFDSNQKNWFEQRAFLFRFDRKKIDALPSACTQTAQAYLFIEFMYEKWNSLPTIMSSHPHPPAHICNPECVCVYTCMCTCGVCVGVYKCMCTCSVERALTPARPPPLSRIHTHLCQRRIRQ